MDPFVGRRSRARRPPCPARRRPAGPPVGGRGAGPGRDRQDGAARAVPRRGGGRSIAAVSERADRAREPTVRRRGPGRPETHGSAGERRGGREPARLRGAGPAGAVRGAGGSGAAGRDRATVGAGADPRRDLPARAARRARDRRPRRAGRRRPALGGPAVGARAGVRAAPAGGRPGAGRAGDARRRRHGAAGEPAPGRVGSPRRRRAARRPGRGRPARAGGAGSGSRRCPPAPRGGCGTARAGNPLHVRAVLDEVAGLDEVPDGWRDERQPLPSPRSFRLLVGDRYAACADDTRRLVDAAAVLGVRSPLPLAASVGEVGEPVQAVDEAVARGLLVAETAAHPWGLAFPHPLVRSAVHDALGPARRRALHLAAAELGRGRGRGAAPPGRRGAGAGRCARRRPRGVRPPGGRRPAVAERHPPPRRVRPAVSRSRRGPPQAARRAELDAAGRRRGERGRVHRRAARPARRAAARQRAGHAGHGPRRSGRGRGDVRQRVEAVRP